MVDGAARRSSPKRGAASALLSRPPVRRYPSPVDPAPSSTVTMTSHPHRVPRRRTVTLSIGVLAIGSAFCLTALLGARAAMAAGHGAKAAPPVILVTLGKPSEFRITLS